MEEQQCAECNKMFLFDPYKHHEPLMWENSETGEIGKFYFCSDCEHIVDDYLKKRYEKQERGVV